MKNFAIPAAALMAVTAVTTVFAQSATGARLDFTDIDLDRYADAPFGDRETDLAVSVLTDEGVLRGNDDGTFRSTRNLNRAEFVQIVMRLLEDTGTVNRNCFPDVDPGAWYADPVCRAKALGIVRGNALAGVPESQWRFEPSRDVQYEEAVKMLVQVYALPITGDTEGDDWYVPYVRAARDRGLDLPGLVPGERITRGEMARLTLAFLAEARGQLDEYRRAEDDEDFGSPSSSSRSSSSSSRTSSSSTSSSSSSSSVSSGGSFDPDDDLRVRSNFLLLGEVTPVLGAVNFFAAQEPIDVDTIRIRFTGNPNAIQQVRVYAEADGRLLGTSFYKASGDYEISVPTGTLRLPHREETGVYVRALLKPADGGARGGSIVQIAEIELDGDGEWSNSEYTVTSTDTFLQSETTPALITGFDPATSLTSSLFTSGPSVTLWDYNVTGRSTDNDYEARLTSLTFRVAKSSDVTLSDVHLTVPDSGAESDCSVTSGLITCDNIAEGVGTVDGTQRIRLMADIAHGGSDNPFLQVTLQEGGGPLGPGDIVWSDGSTTYDWLDLDAPIARGIEYR